MSSSRLRMPAETGPHERTVMCWPTRVELYGELLSEAERAHAEVAATIARFEPVTMLAPAAVSARAADQCGGDVEIVELPTDDSWFRDTGPIYVTADDGRRVALDWIFNSWGEKYAPFQRDEALARAWAEHARHEVRSVPMVLEGGSIAVDGDGTLVTTTQCLMQPNRNPDLTRADIERTLCDELGIDVVLWLPHGLALDDDTDGHVDNVAAFAARPGTLVMQGCDDASKSDALRTNVNQRVAAGALDAAGRRLEVVEIPVLPFREIGGRRVAVPYLNYYVGNGFVVIPVAGHAADVDMVAIIAEQYPGRQTVALDVGAVLAFGGGGIHCITQQVPAV